MLLKQFFFLTVFLSVVMMESSAWADALDDSCNFNGEGVTIRYTDLVSGNKSFPEVEPNQLKIAYNKSTDICLFQGETNVKTSDGKTHILKIEFSVNKSQSLQSGKLADLKGKILIENSTPFWNSSWQTLQGREMGDLDTSKYFQASSYDSLTKEVTGLLLVVFYGG